MLKVDEATLLRMEELFPGIMQTIASFESSSYPSCPACGSTNTASVSAGVIGRSIHIATATTRLRLLINDRPGEYYCWECSRYFDDR